MSCPIKLFNFDARRQSNMKRVRPDESVLLLFQLPHADTYERASKWSSIWRPKPQFLRSPAPRSSHPRQTHFDPENLGTPLSLHCNTVRALSTSLHTSSLCLQHFGAGCVRPTVGIHITCERAQYNIYHPRTMAEFLLSRAY